MQAGNFRDWHAKRAHFLRAVADQQRLTLGASSHRLVPPKLLGGTRVGSVVRARWEPFEISTFFTLSQSGVWQRTSSYPKVAEKLRTRKFTPGDPNEL